MLPDNLLNYRVVNRCSRDYLPQRGGLAIKL